MREIYGESERGSMTTKTQQTIDAVAEAIEREGVSEADTKYFAQVAYQEVKRREIDALLEALRNIQIAIWADCFEGRDNGADVLADMKQLTENPNDK